MTTPGFPQLPNVELGNTASDFSSAVSSFAKGLQEERTRRRQEAMSNALMNLKMQEFLHPRPMHELQLGPEGPMNVDINPTTLETMRSSPAPDSQMPIMTQDADTGAWNLGMTSRTNPSAPVRPVQMPAGQEARGPAPIPVIQETPAGPRTVMTPRTPHATVPAGQQPLQQPSVPNQHQSIQPQPTPTGIPTRASEADEQRARGAFDMVQGRYEMREALKAAGQGRNPQEMQQNAQRTYDEAARYISSLQIGEGIPVLGNVINAIISQGQSVLSPAAARYFSAFMHSAAAKAFSQGGKTLTKNEIDYSLMSMSPKPFEDEATSQMRDRLWNGVISGATAGNNAWMRYQAAAKALGYDDSQTGLMIQPPAQQDINPLTGLPMGHRRNH